MNKKYYIEFIHSNSDAENYDMQSRWFDKKRDAKKWLFENFDFIDDEVNVFLMTAEWYDEDSYDITSSERIKH